jgi:hypothetical protein
MISQGHIFRPNKMKCGRNIEDLKVPANPDIELNLEIAANI